MHERKICISFKEYKYRYLWKEWRLRKISLTYISWELDEAVEHVESVKVDSRRGHCIMPEAQGLAQLLNKPAIQIGFTKGSADTDESA